MKTPEEIKKPICERCEKLVDEIFPCERCGLRICEKCQATYNQFTQIDYTCCKSCAERNDK